jgi:hypothetical protein
MRVGAELHVSFISALVGGEWSVSCAGHFTSGEKDSQRLGGPQSQSAQHAEENILNPTGTRTPARSQLLVHVNAI